MASNLERCERLPTTTVTAASFGCLAPPVAPAIGTFRSGFGVRPGRTSGAPTFHAGVDFEAPAGSPVFAIASGQVYAVASNDDTRKGAYNGYGNAVVIRHGNGLWSFYGHLTKALVTASQQVQAGQLIGVSGNTTNGKFPGMGAHLHFEIRVSGSGGAAPFPGPYCKYNLDPKTFFEAAGMSFGLGGKITATAGSNAACGIARVNTAAKALQADLRAKYAAGTLPSDERTLYKRIQDAAFAGLRGLGATTDEEEDNAYEPPEGPDWSVKWGPLLVYGGVGALGAAALLGLGYWYTRRR